MTSIPWHQRQRIPIRWEPASLAPPRRRRCRGRGGGRILGRMRTRLQSFKDGRSPALRPHPSVPGVEERVPILLKTPVGRPRMPYPCAPTTRCRLGHTQRARPPIANPAPRRRTTCGRSSGTKSIVRSPCFQEHPPLGMSLAPLGRPSRQILGRNRAPHRPTTCSK